MRLDVDRSSDVLDDALADREAEPGPLALGGEEGDEEVLEHLLRDPGAGVADADLDVLDVVGPRRGVAVALGRSPGGARLDPALGGAHGDASAPIHGLDGVLDQVDEDLSKLLRVNLGARDPLGQLDPQVDLSDLLRRQDLNGATYRRVDVERNRISGVGARVVEEAA